MPEELGHNIRPREDIDSNSHGETCPEEDSIDSKTNLRRPNRPPDLKIALDDNIAHVGTVVETVMAASSDIEEEVVTTVQQQHSSTPSKLSGNGSYSFASESMIKNISSEFIILDIETIALCTMYTYLKLFIMISLTPFCIVFSYVVHLNLHVYALCFLFGWYFSFFVR